MASARVFLESSEQGLTRTHVHIRKRIMGKWHISPGDTGGMSTDALSNRTEDPPECGRCGAKSAPLLKLYCR